MTLIESFRTNFSHCGQSFRTCFSTSDCLVSIVNYSNKLFTMINQFEVNTLANSNTILLILSTEISKHGSSSSLCQTRSIATDGKNVT
jgi:hypothetical protein